LLLDLRMPSSPVTQSRAERHQICRFGISWSRWRRMPTRTMYIACCPSPGVVD